MNILALIETVLALLQIAASATKNTADDNIVAEIEAAVAALERVLGSEVTRAQLEGMRFEPKW